METNQFHIPDMGLFLKIVFLHFCGSNELFGIQEIIGMKGRSTITWVLVSGHCFLFTFQWFSRKLQSFHKYS